jgi:hypothetical protein
MASGDKKTTTAPQQSSKNTKPTNAPQSSKSNSDDVLIKRPAMITTGRQVLRIGIISSRQSAGIDEERIIDYGKPVSIGREAKNTFAFPSHAKLPETFTLFQPVGGRYVLRFSEKMDGKITQKNGEEATLQDWKGKKAEKKGDLYELPIEESWRGKIVLGEITFLFSYVPEKRAAKPVLPDALKTPFLERIDKSMALVFMISLMLHGVIAGIAATRIVPDQEPDFDEGNLLVGILVQQPPAIAEPEPDPGPEEKPVEAPKEEAKVAKPENHTKAADAGAPDVKKTDVSRVGALAALGRLSENGGAFADMYSDSSAENALDNISPTAGAALAQAGTDLGAGLRPGNGGNGGDGSGDLAGLNASDIGAKGANTNVTPGTKGPEKKITGKVSGGGASIEEGEGGTLDGAAITAVINRYKSGIQNCYERALVENEGLQGKITVQFSISEAGRVVSTTATDDTVGNAGVQSCVLGIIGRLKFPTNEGGGVVKTNSTFVFAKNN